MRAKKVLQLLKVTRTTLTKYVKSGKIKVEKLPNNLFYEYDDNSVYSLLNKNVVRKYVMYCRVSSELQMEELEKQKKKIEKYFVENKIENGGTYYDVCTGLSINGSGLIQLILDVVNKKISKVFVVSNDRLSKNSFDFIENLFKENDCEIIAISPEDGDLYSKNESLTDLISIIEKTTKENLSTRIKKKLENILGDLELEKEIQQIV